MAGNTTNSNTQPKLEVILKKTTGEVLFSAQDTSKQQLARDLSAHLDDKSFPACERIIGDMYRQSVTQKLVDGHTLLVHLFVSPAASSPAPV